MATIVDKNFRDFERYYGDGLPDEPGPEHGLPIGDPKSGEHDIPKSAFRDVLNSILTATTSVPAGASSTESPILVRVYPSSSGAPSQYLRIYTPIVGSGYTNILLKRGSLSTDSDDVGTSQVTWEPDETEALLDALLIDSASTNISGNWFTNTVGGYWVHESDNPGAARSWQFTGSLIRFGYFETVGSASFDLEVDGVVIASVAKGTVQGRRVFVRDNLAGGVHTIIARRTDTGAAYLRIQGPIIADATGTMPGTATLLNEIDDPAGSLVQSGVQTFVVAVEGGKRMGGGHGGTWARTPASITVDGKKVIVDETAEAYHAGQEVIISESFEMRQSSGASPTALVTRRMIFRGHGYYCDMDIRLPSPVAFDDFFWGMAKAGTALTRLVLPIDAALTSVPFQTLSQLVAMAGNGLRVDVVADGTIQNDGPDQYTYVTDAGGAAKLYNVGALNTAHTFTGRQRLNYSIAFSAT